MHLEVRTVERILGERQWTVYRLAATAGMHREAIRLAIARGTATLETIVHLARALDLAVEDLSPDAATLLDGVRVRRDA